MSNTMTLIGVLAVLVLCSSFFSATETAYSSINRIKLKNMASAGSRKAQKALELAEGYDRLLSTILVGNNVVNSLASSLATVLFVSQSFDGSHDGGDSDLWRDLTEKHCQGKSGEVCDGGGRSDRIHSDAVDADQFPVQFMEKTAFDVV